MSNPTLEHDLALKKTVHTPVEQKPHYAWRDVVVGEAFEMPSVVLLCPHGEEKFDMAEVADTLGKALTNVHLARGEKDIFNDNNRDWLLGICRELASNLHELDQSRSPVRLSLNSLYELIEKTRSCLGASRKSKSPSAKPFFLSSVIRLQRWPSPRPSLNVLMAPNNPSSISKKFRIWFRKN